MKKTTALLYCYCAINSPLATADPMITCKRMSENQVTTSVENHMNQLDAVYEGTNLSDLQVTGIAYVFDEITDGLTDDLKPVKLNSALQSYASDAVRPGLSVEQVIRFTEQRSKYAGYLKQYASGSNWYRAGQGIHTVEGRSSRGQMSQTAMQPYQPLIQNLPWVNETNTKMEQINITMVSPSETTQVVSNWVKPGTFNYHAITVLDLRLKSYGPSRFDDLFRLIKKFTTIYKCTITTNFGINLQPPLIDFGKTQAGDDEKITRTIEMRVDGTQPLPLGSYWMVTPLDGKQKLNLGGGAVTIAEDRGRPIKLGEWVETWGYVDTIKFTLDPASAKPGMYETGVVITLRTP